MQEVNWDKAQILHKLGSGLGLLVLFCTVAAAQITTYTVTDLGTLGGTFSDTGGANIRGQVAGGSTLIDDSTMHAFLWTNAKMKDLGTLGGPNSFANFVNSRSAAVGLSDVSTVPGNPSVCSIEFVNTVNQCHAFVWQNSVMTDLRTLGGLNSAVLGAGINDWGQVVGVAETNDSDPNNPGYQVIHAFLWSAGIMTDLGSLAKRDRLAHSEAFNINDLGQVVGFANTTSTPQSSCGDCIPEHAFLWQKGVMKDLGTFPGGNYAMR